MDVLLINPLIGNLIKANIPEFLDRETGHNPSLGGVAS